MAQVDDQVGDLGCREPMSGTMFLERIVFAALQFNQNHAPTHKALAGYYQKLGQMGLALRHWEMSGGQLGKSNK
jgi:hypothetical protein